MTFSRNYRSSFALSTLVNVMHVQLVYAAFFTATLGSKFEACLPVWLFLTWTCWCVLLRTLSGSILTPASRNSCPSISASLSTNCSVYTRVCLNKGRHQLTHIWLQHPDFLFGYTGVRRKFSWGVVSISGIWWSFVFGVRSLWRHNLTSYVSKPTFWRSLLT